MHKFFTPKELINGDVAKILGDDVKHIYKVLRIAEGEKVVLNNCEGLEYLAKVTDVNKQEVSLEIIEKLDLNNESELLDFLEHKSYEISESSILEIKHSSAGNSLNPK